MHKSTNTNAAFEELHSVIIKTIDKYAPERTTLAKNKGHNEPWVTPGINKSLKKQRLLYKDLIKSNVATCKSIKYKDYKRCLQRIIRASKVSYYSQQCVQHKSNTKKLWELINTVIRKSPNKLNIIDKLQVGDIEITDGNSIADHLNNHFSSVGNTYANKIPPSKRDIGAYTNAIPMQSTSLCMYPTNVTETSCLIQKLLNKKSSGYDEINNILLKKISVGILLPLTEEMNKSLKEGIFPEKMKHADVCPLYKSNDRLDKNNYSPISLLITMSKLLEKLVHNRTYTFLENTGQIFASQYGFRTKHSCEQAVSELLSEIVKGHYTKNQLLQSFWT